MSTHGVSDSYEYLDLFNILISKKIVGGEQELLSEYVIELNRFLEKAVKTKVERILIYVSGSLLKRKPALHQWFRDYLLPQLKYSEVKRIAFLSNSPVYPGRDVMIFGASPQIGVFVSKSEAIAWLVSLRLYPPTKFSHYKTNLASHNTNNQ